MRGQLAGLQSQQELGSSSGQKESAGSDGGGWKLLLARAAWLMKWCLRFAFQMQVGGSEGRELPSPRQQHQPSRELELRASHGFSQLQQAVLRLLLQTNYAEELQFVQPTA